MAPLERAVLLRSLGTSSGKFHLPKTAGRTFQGPVCGKESARPARKNRNRIFLNFCRAYPQRGLTAKAGGPLQRRHNHGNGPDVSEGDDSGRHRRSFTPGAAAADMRLPGPRISLSIALPNPTCQRRGPQPHRPPSCARFRSRVRQLAIGSRTGGAPGQARQSRTRCLIRNRTAPRVDGQARMSLRIARGPRGLVS